MTAFQWWSHVIQDTLSEAGAPAESLAAVEQQLVQALIERFWCRDGYAIHDDVEPFLANLEALATRIRLPGLARTAVASGSDQGVVKVLRDLDILRDGSIEEHEVFTTWQLETDKRTKQFWKRVLHRLSELAVSRGEPTLDASEVLVVGDELIA
ncbi:hypothetical protein OIV83_003482 [Microbotryomycetes sp. JL201]|nr:hypothetical protein OIV83_003482 [Microbotryomycetes sp. JL201]